MNETKRHVPMTHEELGQNLEWAATASIVDSAKRIIVRLVTEVFRLRQRARLQRQRIRELLAGAMPCGHTFADLIGGTNPDWHPRVTKCGACLARRQPEIREKNAARAVLISGLRAMIDRGLLVASFVPDLEERLRAYFGSDWPAGADVPTGRGEPGAAPSTPSELAALPTPEEMAKDAIGDEPGRVYDTARGDFARGVQAERDRAGAAHA